MFKLSSTLMRFIFTGSLNAIFTVCIYYGLLEIWHWHHLISLSIAWICGVLFTYVFNYSWVFKPEKNFQFNQRFFKHFFIYFLSLTMNLFLLQMLVGYFGLEPFFAQIGLIPMIVVFNYCLTKMWSMKIDLMEQDRI